MTRPSRHGGAAGLLSDYPVGSEPVALEPVVPEPVPESDKPTAETGGTQGRVPGLCRGDDMTDKFRRLVPRRRSDPAQRGTSTDQISEDPVNRIREPDLGLRVGHQLASQPTIRPGLRVKGLSAVAVIKPSPLRGPTGAAHACERRGVRHVVPA